MTGHVDVSERAVLFASLARDPILQETSGFRQKVDQLAFSLVGLSAKEAGVVMDEVVQGIQDQVSEALLYLFVEAVVKRKIEIEPGTPFAYLQ